MRRLSAKPKPYKVADESGLFLLVQPTGAKLWKMKYRIHGYERKLAIGRYPEVSLSKARERRDGRLHCRFDFAWIGPFKPDKYVIDQKTSLI